MTMQGTAFLPIWHDVDGPVEFEFNHWHTVEHMPERLATPGIVVGRRYECAQVAKYRYYVLYEAATFDVFASEGYYATANARSEWSKRVHPHFQNFLRSPCHLVMTRGRGIGGAMATVRITFDRPAGDLRPGTELTTKDAYTLAVRPLVEQMMQIELVTSVHAGITAPVARMPLSRESLSLRPNATSFNGVLMIEGISGTALRDVRPRIAALVDQHVGEFASYELEIYNLSYVITARDG